jgi:hypothetical protein
VDVSDVNAAAEFEVILNIEALLTMQDFILGTNASLTLVMLGE